MASYYQMENTNINWELITALLAGEKLGDDEINIVLGQIKENPGLINNAEDLLFIIQKIKYARKGNQIDLQKNWTKINSNIKTGNRKKTIGLTLKIAASVIILFTFSFYFFFIKNDFYITQRNNKHIAHLGQRSAINADMFLIRNTDTIPVLTGDDFIIDNVHFKYSSRKEGLSFEAPEKQDPVIEYAINVPHGKQAKVTLDDGSVVWLNSTSTLKYPLLFNKQDREVSLIGEGLFEVISNAGKKFIVNTENNTKVVVHGTLFNVKAYREEDKIITTLVYGSVGFELPDGREKELLPGNQGIYCKSGDKYINKSSVNTLYYTKWKEGIYLFTNEEMKDIALQLERWYGVKIILNDGLGSKRLSGAFELERPLSYFLNNIEKTINIKYEAYEETVRISNGDF